MSNVTQVKKVSHVLSAAEAAGQWTQKIFWESPFNDTNYVISTVIEGITAAASAYNAISNVTPAGFTFSGTSLAGTAAGDTFTIHAMASANDSQCKKISHVVTAAEVAGFVVVIPILWAVPFNDSNYALSCVVEGKSGYSGYCAPHNATRTGVTVAVVGNFVAGDTVTLHVFASHK